ncbi:unnamed protein product [Linum trigynum]|uniref:Uncharacterized protein n=1 Tax=Linum trigynum TaxID=586398 RepID=A0AAV2EUH7_9ROSI
MRKPLNNLKRSFSSFHLCRTKRGDAVAPTAAAYRHSPYNPKARDTNFPKFLSPPPTTPDDRRRPLGNQPRRMVVSHSRSPLLHDNLSASDCNSDSIKSARRSDTRW